MPPRTPESLADAQRFFATATRGAEPFAREELERLGARNCVLAPGGVAFEASLEVVLASCLWLRTVSKLLLLLGTENVRNEDDVYEAMRSLPLTRWFTSTHSLCVRAHVDSRGFRNSHFVALRVKDAIVDAMRDRHGSRPSVSIDDPDLEVVVHLVRGRLSIYLGLQGAPLHQRGYRKAQTEAPLKETLAATLLAFAGWRGGEAFVDPTCGSGTIAIEAALIMLGAAPGAQRGFGIERWPGFGDEGARILARLRNEAREQQRKPERILIGSDVDPSALKAARINAVNAGVAHCVQFVRGDARALVVPETPTTVCCNPPYGERMGAFDASAGHASSRDARSRSTLARSVPGSERISTAGSLPELHTRIADAVRNLPGCSLTLLSVPELLRQTHLKPDARQIVFNGPLRCEMARYQIRERVPAPEPTEAESMP